MWERIADHDMQYDCSHHLRWRWGVVHRLRRSRLAQVRQLWPLQHHLVWKCEQPTTSVTTTNVTSFCETREFMTGMSIGATMGVTGGGDESRVTEAGKRIPIIKLNTINKTSLLEKIPPRVWLKCPKIYTFQLVSDLLLLWTPNVTNKQLFIPRTFRWNCYLIRRILISIGQTFTF